MNRRWESRALVLKSQIQGEAHRMLWFLTEDRGLVTALAPGAAKGSGRLRVLSTPFAQVRGKFYHDPVKDWHRVEDLEEVYLPEGLGQNVLKLTIASLWAEVLLASHGGGESPGTFELACRALIALDQAEEDRAGAYNLVFLWKLMENWGWAPEFSFCGACGKSTKGLEVLYNRREGEVLCRDCAPEEGGFWDRETLEWLTRALEGRLRLPCPPRVRQELWDGVLGTLGSHLEKELKSLGVLRGLGGGF